VNGTSTGVFNLTIATTTVRTVGTEDLRVAVRMMTRAAAGGALKIGSATNTDDSRARMMTMVDPPALRRGGALRRIGRVMNMGGSKVRMIGAGPAAAHRDANGMTMVVSKVRRTTMIVPHVSCRADDPHKTVRGTNTGDSRARMTAGAVPVAARETRMMTTIVPRVHPRGGVLPRTNPAMNMGGSKVRAGVSGGAVRMTMIRAHGAASRVGGMVPRLAQVRMTANAMSMVDSKMKAADPKEEAGMTMILVGAAMADAAGRIANAMNMVGSRAAAVRVNADPMTRTTIALGVGRAAVHKISRAMNMAGLKVRMSPIDTRDPDPGGEVDRVITKKNTQEEAHATEAPAIGNRE